MKLRTIFLIIIIVTLFGFGIYWLISTILTGFGKSDSTPSLQKTESSAQIPIATEAKIASANILDINPFTPSNYKAPSYDPFSNKYKTDYSFEETLPTHNKKPSFEVDLSVRHKKSGLADRESGTTQTEFIFTALTRSRSNENTSKPVWVRWDFNNDGTPDNYFSLIHTAEHVFTKSGVYTVAVEALDSKGNISRGTRNITIVENTPPVASFEIRASRYTTKEVISFKTRSSYDHQYLKPYLEYRFDWDGDGNWDTPYNKKTQWQHIFQNAGEFSVLMEVKDPQGLTASSRLILSIHENIPPVSHFFIEEKSSRPQNDSQKNIFYFNAGESSDSETPENKLLYRWDFNYSGKDDITFDRQFSTAKRVSFQLNTPGTRVIRLQVKDQDGAVSESFATLNF